MKPSINKKDAFLSCFCPFPPVILAQLSLQPSPDIPEEYSWENDINAIVFLKGHCTIFLKDSFFFSGDVIVQMDFKTIPTVKLEIITIFFTEYFQ